MTNKQMEKAAFALGYRKGGGRKPASRESTNKVKAILAGPLTLNKMICQAKYNEARRLAQDRFIYPGFIYH